MSWWNKIWKNITDTAANNRKIMARQNALTIEQAIRGSKGCPKCEQKARKSYLHWDRIEREDVCVNCYLKFSEYYKENRSPSNYKQKYIRLTDEVLARSRKVECPQCGLMVKEIEKKYGMCRICAITNCEGEIIKEIEKISKKG